ncbi:hypothetical protein OIU84_022522 [Salix udensis]|uniref:Uncharacterized protein n=1 Tax=Salix udensis TaxID=889485 RepID=A0AAD6PFB6_9ROSI|nr:hypothetical protein OIU84_022522 [Salix udensis]
MLWETQIGGPEQSRPPSSSFVPLPPFLPFLWPSGQHPQLPWQLY